MSFRGLARKVMLVSLLAGVPLFVFAVSGAFSTFFYLKREVQGLVVLVPDLSGKTETEALALCQAGGLLLKVESQRVHCHVPKDQVYVQIPPAGRRIKTGRTIEVTLSDGPEIKRVPKLEGETLTFSQTLLAEVEMEAKIVARVPSRLEAGKIVAQAPVAGKELGVRQGPSVLVSNGPDMPYYVAPELMGRDYTVVRKFLEEQGIRAIVKHRIANEDLGPVVVDQNPKPGYPFRKGDTMTVVVNKD